MRIVDRVERVGRGREIKAAGTVCMAAAWILLATPALAQDANGMAQNGADLKGGAAQEERTGISRPDSAAITVTPYSDDADSNSPSAQPAPPAKPSAATPAAATPAAAPATNPSASLNRRAAAKLMPTADSEGIAASGKDAAGFDPDASIVTEETAGRADRLLQSETLAEEKPDTGIVTLVPSRPGEVPDGTLVKVKLMEELSSLTTKPGTSFTAEVSEPVLRDGQVVVPVGALLEGRVTWVREGRRVGAAAAIHLEASTVTLPDGSRYMLRARVIDTNSWDDTKVDSEGTILRKDHPKAMDAMTSLSTVGGMAAGAAMGGVPGAVIGAGLGAGVSTAVWMRQDRQADLPVDLGVVFCLTEPMRVTPMSARLTRPGAGSGGE